MRLVLLYALLGTIAQAKPIQITLKVVDERGSPVPAARTTVQCRGMNSAVPTDFTGETNQVGLYQLRAESWSGLYLEASKAGHYAARLYDQPDEADLTQEIVLPRQINPRPLFVKFYNGNPDRGLHFPQSNAWFDYDLKVGDWLTPHGKGTVADFRIKITSLPNQGEMQWELSSIDANGGFATPSHLLKYSELKMPHQAPATGYVKSVVLTNQEDPMDVALFIRSRVQVDGAGKIISAHYGKIQGPVAINRRGSLTFTHYFNCICIE